MGSGSKAEEFVKSHQLERRVGAGVEHFVGEKGRVFVSGNATIFLLPLFFIDALSFEAFEEILPRFVAASFFVDALDDALGDGFIDGDFVKRPAGPKAS